MKKIVFLSIFLLLASFSFSENIKKISLVFTSSLEGNAYEYKEEGKYYGGISYIATQIDEILIKAHAKNYDTIVFDAGNSHSGTAEAYYSNGYIIKDFYNLMGYEIVGVSSRELELGIKNMNNISSSSNYNLVLSNTKKEIRGVNKKVVIDKGDYKVCFMNIFLEEKAKDYEIYIKETGFVSENNPETVEEIKKNSKENDLLVVITQGKNDFESPMYKINADNIVYITKTKEESEKSYSVDRLGKEVGQLDIKIDIDKDKILSKEFQIYTVSSENLSESKEASKIINKYKKLIDESTKTIIGKNLNFIDRASAYEKESEIASLVTEAFASLYNCDMVITNTGGVRTNLPIGEIDRGMVFNLLPFVNFNVLVKMKGKDIYETLKRANIREDGRIRAQTDKRVKQIITGDDMQVLYKGKPLEFEKDYTILANTYILGGGDGMTEFLNSEVLEFGDLARNDFEKYVLYKGLIDFKFEDSIIYK